MHRGTLEARTRQRRRDRSRGAVAVEFGLIVPLLLLLLMGLIDFGYMIYNSTLVNNAARDGARLASLNGTYSEVTDLVNDELTDVGINGATVTVTCTTNTGTPLCSNSAASFDANATSGSRVQVAVTYNYKWITPVGSLCRLFKGNCVGNTLDLQRTAEMVRE